MLEWGGRLRHAIRAGDRVCNRAAWAEQIIRITHGAGISGKMALMNTTLRIELRQVAEPITRPETKFGGDPVWIDGPQWPLSRRYGCPMQFIGQVAIDPRVFPNAVARMAYIFMTDLDGGDLTWDPDAGENAVILQPGD